MQHLSDNTFTGARRTQYLSVNIFTGARRTQHLSVDTKFVESESGKISTQYNFQPSVGTHFMNYKVLQKFELSLILTNVAALSSPPFLIG